MTADRARSPRVLSIVPRFPSVSETFIERKARALLGRGIEVTVGAPRLEPQQGLAADDRVPTLQLPVPKRPSTWGAALASLVGTPALRRAPATVRRLGRNSWLLPATSGRFDIVHFEFSGAAAGALEALPLLRPALLAVSCRGTAEKSAPQQDPERARRLRAVFAEVDLIHCVSDDMAETVRRLGAPAEKILVNRPAIDTTSWVGVGRVDPTVRGTAEAPLRVVSVSRLHWMKGLDDAIRAVAAARASGVHIHYRIAGEGDEQDKLHYLRHSLGVTDAVDLLGPQSQDEVRGLLGWADAFLLPSLSEGISNSVLEAMAAGVPVISTRCGGMEEVIVESTGLMVDVGDVDAMATALASLADPERRSALAAGGAARAGADFDLRRQAEVFDDAYRALLSRR